MDLFLVGLRFYFVMIVSKSFTIPLLALFYGFKVILIVFGCSHMDMDGSRPVTASLDKFWLIVGGFKW